jgi:hypothetical protein
VVKEGGAKAGFFLPVPALTPSEPDASCRVSSPALAAQHSSRQASGCPPVIGKCAAHLHAVKRAGGTPRAREGSARAGHGTGEWVGREGGGQSRRQRDVQEGECDA